MIDGQPKWKSGWREVGSFRIYFRSRWDANYARYLQWLKTSGKIFAWEYEPKTFWFEGIKRGRNNYKPDFRIYLIGGAHEWHEVKGRMDDRSILLIKRFRKFFPHEPYRVIDTEKYLEIEHKISHLVPEWEYAEPPKTVAPIGRRLA